MHSSDSGPSTAAPSDSPLTPTMEDYLRAIYKLERESESRVSNSQVAERLDVTRASVTSMFESLEARGLVDRDKYRPVRLTDDGLEAALKVVRKHRLVETLLVEYFGYGLSEVDGEADVLEHHVSDRLCRSIERSLDGPATDPHGDPIPDADLSVAPGDDATRLSALPEATVAEITRIVIQDDDVLEYLASNGIEPSATVSVEARSSVGTVAVAVDGTGNRVTFPERIAMQILVTVETGT